MYIPAREGPVEYFEASDRALEPEARFRFGHVDVDSRLGRDVENSHKERAMCTYVD